MQPIESLYSKGKMQGWPGIPRKILPHTFYCLDGNEIPFGGRIPRGSRCPSIFTNRALVGELIPGSSWGSSLANLLTKGNWDQLRKPIIDRNSGICEFCGKLVGSSLDVHEVWSYSELPTRRELNELPEGHVFFARQTLVKLLGVCKECHECFHPGLAEVKGRINHVERRMCVINSWSSDDFNDYYDTLLQRNQVLSEVYWRLDLSIIASQVEGLLVSKSWKREPENNEILFRDSKNGYGESTTIITGCKWRRTDEEEWSYMSPD